LTPILQKLIEQFDLSLLLYVYHLMAFALISHTKMTITLDLLVQSKWNWCLPPCFPGWAF